MQMGEPGVLRASAEEIATSSDETVEAALLAAIERADAREDGHADHLLKDLFAALRAGPAPLDVKRGGICGARRPRGGSAGR